MEDPFLQLRVQIMEMRSLTIQSSYHIMEEWALQIASCKLQIQQPLLALLITL
jgi:hypothetical protein